MEKLKEKINNLKNLSEEWQSKHDDVLEKNKELEQQLLEKDNLIKSLTTKNEALEADLEKIEEEYKTAKEKFSTVDVKAETLEKKVTSLEREKEELEGKHEDLNAKYVKAKEELDEITDQLNAL